MNIQRQASRFSQNFSLAPPAELAKTASESSAAKIPIVMASCCSEPSRPRSCLGEISAM